MMATRSSPPTFTPGTGAEPAARMADLAAADTWLPMVGVEYEG